MSTSIFFPVTTYVPNLYLRSPLSINDLCKKAGVQCKASGAWINRQLEVHYGTIAEVTCEPGDWGRVRIVLPIRSKREQARAALAVLAYGLHDLVAKQSIIGAAWARPAMKLGRPRTDRALSNAERQRAFRERKKLAKVNIA